MISAQDALRKLREGNTRFAAGKTIRGAHTHLELLEELVAEQNPFAVVLGCSDSRVPAEIIFDQGLGDLFVIRVAGNIIAPSQVASVEFAVERLGARLVVVLGHSGCGAVEATLEELRQTEEKRSRNLSAIVDRIRPAVEHALATHMHADPDELLRVAIKTNIQTSVGQLRHGSEILEEFIAKGGLTIVGAEYSLSTGNVEFLED